MDPLISARWPDLIIINKDKRTWRIVDFAVLADDWVKLKAKEEWVPGPCLGTEKTVEHENDNYTNYVWCSWYSHQKIGKRAGGLGNNRMGGDHPNYSFENGQNTEKSPGDLRRLAVIQTQVKDHQLMLMWKTL